MCCGSCWLSAPPWKTLRVEGRNEALCALRKPGRTGLQIVRCLQIVRYLQEPILWAHFFSSVQFSSVAQLCPTLCDPMNFSTPGLPVHHQLPESTHSSSVVPFSSRPQSFPASGSFPMSQLFASSRQSIRDSASVLPMNIQGWFPLGWTGLISLLSKRISRVFFSTTVQKHQYFSAQLYSPTLTSIHEYWKNNSLDEMDLCW